MPITLTNPYDPVINAVLSNPYIEAIAGEQLSFGNVVTLNASRTALKGTALAALNKYSVRGVVLSDARKDDRVWLTISGRVTILTSPALSHDDLGQTLWLSDTLQGVGVRTVPVAAGNAVVSLGRIVAVEEVEPYVIVDFNPIVAQFTV